MSHCGYPAPVARHVGGHDWNGRIPTHYQPFDSAVRHPPGATCPHHLVNPRLAPVASRKAYRANPLTGVAVGPVRRSGAHAPHYAGGDGYAPDPDYVDAVGFDAGGPDQGYAFAPATFAPGNTWRMAGHRHRAARPGAGAVTAWN